MGRIKKAAGPKHETTLSPALSEFVSTSTNVPLAKLPTHLRSFPSRWPYPRGDLYHWIPLLDLFDRILEDFLTEYGLRDGPQIQRFASRLLQRGMSKGAGEPILGGTSAEGLQLFGYGEEGDRELVEAVLAFSRLLLENCGNRSLYASSERLGYLLNTTSITLLATTLRLASRLAMRYHHSRQKGAGASHQSNSALLASHYNINLDHVQKLADAFVKAVPAVPGSGTAVSSPFNKGKGKASAHEGKRRSVSHGSDMLAAVRQDTQFDLEGNGSLSGDWGNVSFNYYPSPSPGNDDATTLDSAEGGSRGTSASSTPTPVRHPSALSRPTRSSESDFPVARPNRSPAVQAEEQHTGGMKTIFVPHSTIVSTPLEQILKSRLQEISKESQYDFLNRLRAAKYLTESLESRQGIVNIRILALTNLAYVYPEATFQQRVLQQDSDEPRRLQIVQQLADVVHPPDNEKAGIPVGLKTSALGALEAFSKHKARANDVCTALNVNVTHGVLLFILRKTATDLATEDTGDDATESDEWQEALLSLLDSLPSSGSRTAESLVGAGLLEILVDVLKLRTEKAERIHHKVLTFLNTLVHTVRDAFQSFVNFKGLEVISDLIAWEVVSSIARVDEGKGLSDHFKSQVTDYQMPYFQQQTLRWLFKFVNHMLSHGNANFDRLLRNLIDSPPLLAGLRDVLSNGKIFGSTIWSGAVNILSSFIHNEPTSYAVIAEAGLNKSFLESVSSQSRGATRTIFSESEGPRSLVIRRTDSFDAISITSRIETDLNSESGAEELIKLSRTPGEVLAYGILPATDAINAIPSAFGAICLNVNGLDMFLGSGALETFFEIFESHDHVRSMAAETNLPKTLGQHFDELVRHHPRLRSAVMHSVVSMLARVNYYCKARALEKGCGAKLYVQCQDGTISVSGGKDALSGFPKGHDLRGPESISDEDVVMGESSSILSSEDQPSAEQPPSISTYIGVVFKFLSGFFDNQSLCGSFIQEGGLDFLLDLATSPSLPHDFNNQPDSQDLCHVLHLLVEHKPHLVLPMLVARAMDALEILTPLTSRRDNVSFFSEFIRDPLSKGKESTDGSSIDGTTILKALVTIHTLCNVLHEAFMHIPYSSRSHHTLFSQVNLTDPYVHLVKALGRLYRVCVWEEILLQNTISDDLKESTRVNGYGMGSDEADEVFGFISHDQETGLDQNGESSTSTGVHSTSSDTNANVERADSAIKSRKNAHKRNVQSLRFLLSQIPSSITPFLQGLGKSLVSKRRTDPYLKQNAFMIADVLAENALEHLQYDLPKECSEAKDQFAYWIVALTSLSQLMIERPIERPPQCLTLILQAFRNHGGLEYVNGLLGTFFEKIQALTEEKSPNSEAPASIGLLGCLYGGMKLILVFYSQITSHKYVSESSQCQALVSIERDRDSAYHFNPGQFLVEIRASVLSAVQPVWDNSAVDNSSSSILKCLIDILRTTLEADQEQGAAATKASRGPPRSRPEFNPFSIGDEKEKALVEKNFPSDLAREALYRCLNNRESAEEYCHAQKNRLNIPRLPIPSYELTTKKLSRNRPQRQASEDTIPDAESTDDTNASIPSSPVVQAAVGGPQPDSQPLSTTAPDTDGMAVSIDNLLSLHEAPATRGDQGTLSDIVTPMPFTVVDGQDVEATTIEDLDRTRHVLRENLIGRILDILSLHDDITFELSDLIITAAAKSQDSTNWRKETGETLVQSLISFQHQEDFRPSGKRVASYANLLAILIQEQDFYDTSLEELKSNFSSLLSFIKIFPETTPSDAKSPWIAQVLLLIEKLLSEDVQPKQIRWTPPSNGSIEPDRPIAELDVSIVSDEEKLALLESIMAVLPHIGKNQSLALSVVRVLVILTRNREIANRLGEKRNLQGLFVMVRQLVVISNEKFLNTFLIVLRHIIEDEETIKNVMRNEITAYFKNRPTRPTDTTAYVRTMHALVLRAPNIFLEVTSEKLKLERFDPSARAQILVLREDAEKSETGTENTKTAPEDDATVGLSPNAAQPSTEDDLGDGGSAGEKPKAIVEPKFPVVDHPDGVVHFLLSQLLNYKEVDDKDTISTAKESGSPDDQTTSSDVDMGNSGNSSASPSSSSATPGDPETRAEKLEYKAEQHPVYIYRCFLLQCLSELLMSYTRAKIEFINFSRKADPKVMTPSKPRSAVLSYMLNSLIPIETLEQNESMTFRKSIGTSNWAMSAVVSLCAKTSEYQPSQPQDLDNVDGNSDLSFVRKFVLEISLKAFRDVHASNESTGPKYARLLSLADLFSRLLNGRVLPTTPMYAAEAQGHTIKEIARIMFEKNYIAALTSSIAEIDLNYPNSKRAIKYILRPLKVLTQTAIYLSETSDLSTTPGHTDDDEISTATSISDAGEEREETPDLFRHSTLGILDPGGRETESSSDSADDDEDMYEDEYDEGIEYDEDLDRDNDEVISDEDEELGEAGPIEGLNGDVDMDVEVVIDGDEDDEDSSDEDGSEDSDDMDEEDEVEIIDEITGDDGSLDDGQENDWEDEDEDLDDPYALDPMATGLAIHEHLHDDHGHNSGDGLTLNLPTAGGGAAGNDPEGPAMNPEDAVAYLDGYAVALNRQDIADAGFDEEEDDEDAEEDDVAYPGDYDDDDEDHDQPNPWGFAGEQDPPVRVHRGHHHSHVRRIVNPLSMFTQGYPGTDRGPAYRTHRGASGLRGPDEGQNPLLQRSSDATLPGRRGIPIMAAPSGPMGDLVHLLGSRHRQDGVVSLINGMMTTMAPPFGGAHGGALHLHLDSNGGLIPFPRELQSLMGSRALGDSSRASRDNSSLVPTFYPSTTPIRWEEEARLLFGAGFNEKTQRVVNSLLRILVPPAMEEERLLKQKAEEDAETARKRREEEKKALEDQLAKEKGKQAQEKKETEDREAAERAATQQDVVDNDSDSELKDEDAMEGVEATSSESVGEQSDNAGTSADSTTAGPSNEPERIIATFRGREVDITHLGIDLEYLEALPDELREEVLMQQLAEQRSQAAVSGEAPTDINREFLDALPPDIRDEILQQEAQDRRRRDREEARRQAASNGGPPTARAEEMDTASFLASLDPGLRNAVLLEQDEDMIAQLPAAIAAEARALGADRITHRWGDISRGHRHGIQRSDRENPPGETAKKPVRRQIVQMLDKAGVATLLRLLFVSQQGSAREYLNSILENASRNAQNRAEILNILLSILEEGSSDTNAIERSFLHLSLRAKQQPSQKLPQTLKRTPTGSLTAPLSADMTSLMVIQQCLGALVHLTATNAHVPAFFLSEHEPLTGLKGRSSKKGKSKESTESKFAVNTLLCLLDRKVIMDSAVCMEQLSSLMQSISQPLVIFRREMDRVQDTSEEDKSSQDHSEAPVSAAEPAANPSEHPEEPGVTSTTRVTGDEIENDSATPAQSNPGQGASSNKEPKKGTLPRKLRDFQLPVIPEHNFRLVVNVLGARECSSQTFRDTLSTINNLSTIPGAKDVFGKELVKVSQGLGETITHDLDLLVSQIQSSDSSDDVHGTALSKFSPSSSNQAKLLRVLTALDYLFDPKRAIAQTDESGLADVPKEDLVATLYESSTFGPLWSKLSDCLKYMRQRDNMLNTATVLLPLVESLMVVCKNTTLRETANKASKEFAVMSPAPESAMDGLFFHFTEEHRKILNDLVRNNPRLMSGTFSLLVQNPKVLEFDNKRNYFTRRLHTRSDVRHTQTPLQLSIRRDQTFLDSYRSLYFKAPDEMKYGKLSIRFHGEDGVDAGGVTREWFQTMSRQMFNADYALFVPVASDRTTFHPNRLSHVNEEHLFYFKFIGRIIGKALYEGRALDCHFSRAVYKRILGKSVSVKDMETLDLEYYKSLLWMLENDIEGIITETFSIETEVFGVTEVIDLVENGRNIPVAEDNKQEYVQLVVEYRLTGSVKDQLEEFLKGFHDIVPAELISIFNEQELELLISGLPDINVDDWKNNTEYHNYSASSAQIQWFWRAVRSFDKEERAKLLQFVTGTAKVPLNGFNELEGMNGFSRFNIHRDYGNKNRLPSSHTCFNQLDLPEYEDYEALRKQLYTAVTAGSEYFGFA